MQEAAAFGSKLRPYQALIRSDFEPLYELEPAKVLPLHSVSLCQPIT